MLLPFTKMEGCGNDYVYVDAIRAPLPIERAPSLARRWSDRHFGVGADGLIVMQRGDAAPVRMLMWNADGSRAEMCGNGLRCLARLAHEHGHVSTAAFSVETDAGVRAVELLAGAAVRAAMGSVTLGEALTVDVAGRRRELIPGDAGNPHAVLFVADVDRADVVGIGAALQGCAAFPNGVNVEFVQVLAPDRLRQRTFERGSGETLACGTGAAVAARAAWRRANIVGAATHVELRGGTLIVRDDGASLAIEGPARTVFRGEIELS